MVRKLDILALYFLGLAYLPVYAQQISDDSINFSSASGIWDMRACARCPLIIDFSVCNVGKYIPDRVGCETNKCLCRPSTFGLAALLQWRWPKHCHTVTLGILFTKRLYLNWVCCSGKRDKCVDHHSDDYGCNDDSYCLQDSDGDNFDCQYPTNLLNTYIPDSSYLLHYILFRLFIHCRPKLIKISHFRYQLLHCCNCLERFAYPIQVEQPCHWIDCNLSATYFEQRDSVHS